MRFIVVLLAAGLTIVSATSKEDCMKLTGLHPCCLEPERAEKKNSKDMSAIEEYLHGKSFASRLCCKKPTFLFEEKYEDMKECFALRGKPTCELDICIATKKGIASGNGKIDRKAYEEEIDKSFDFDQEMVEAMKKNCIHGDVTKFGKPFDCELAKIRQCIHLNMLLFCRAFDESGPCSGLKELVEECNKS